MIVRTREDLREEQITISNLIYDNDAHLVISAMASGKTGATLDAVMRLLNEYEVQHILVIGPKFVAKNTWPDEIAAWKHVKAVSYSVAVGDPIVRREAIDARSEITMINFESLGWLAKYIGSVRNWYWDMVIIDESSRFKAGEGRTKATIVKKADGKRKRTKGGNMTRFGVMATARKMINRIVELTGTPTPQGPIDLWGQIYLLDQGESLGRTKLDFEKKYYTKNPYNHTMKIKEGSEAEILAKCNHLATTIPKRKLVEDPDILPIKVHLDPTIMKQYKEFEETLYSQEYDVEAVSNGVLANKLLQFANGHMYQEDRTVVHIHDTKMDALDELIESAHGENIMCFYSFQFDKDAIKKRYPHAVVASESDDFIDKWNKRKIKLLLAHPASIGHGTNLQFGGHIAAWYGLTFSLELWQQANARLPRPGQTERVLIYPIIAEGTYDERAIVSLDKKDATQERVIQSFLNRS